MTPPTERIRETGQKQKTCSCGFPVCYLDTQYIFMPLSHLEAVRHIHTYPKKYSLALPLAPEPLNDQENPVCKENIMSSLRVIHALCKATKKLYSHQSLAVQGPLVALALHGHLKLPGK